MNYLLNLKSFFQFLKKNQRYTLIEIFGLSISLMFVILIALYTKQELSTDSFQKKADRIYVLAKDDSFGFAYKIGVPIKDRYPEIENICSTTPINNAPIKIIDQKTKADLLLVDSSFFQVFSFELINGDPNHVFDIKNQAVISESFAKRIFPNTDPLGKQIQVHDSLTVTVNGVMKDIKNSVIPYGDILFHFENIKFWNPGLVSPEYHNFGSIPIYVLAKEGANLTAKTDDLLDYLKEHTWIYKRGVSTIVNFVPLKDIYFSKISGHNGYILKQGNKSFVYILLSVGILILLFAIINYINLTVAQTGFRAKEMATRKLLGSSRQELFIRLMMESTLLTFISFCIGLILAYVATPYVNDLLDTRIDIKAIWSPLTLSISILFILLIGSFSGLLPAIIISNTKAIEVVKGTFRKKTKMVFSKFFITFQNAITIALITASLVMVFQINHLINAPLGYSTTNILDISVRELRDKQLCIRLGDEFKNLAAVKRVGFNQGLPFHSGSNYTMPYGDRNISFQGFAGDSTFFNMLEIEIIRDNNLLPGEGPFLSQQAIRELEISEDAKTCVLWDSTFHIAGVFKDFQLHNILKEAHPVIVRIEKIENFDPFNIAVEVTGDPYTAYNQIKDIYERHTQLEFPGKFIDQQVEESFEQQRKTSKILIIFSGIAILLSLLGLIAMSTYFIQQRSREIAVRKVFGSNNSQILKDLIFTFLLYAVIAFVIVTPIIWYIMTQWLSTYSYRIELSPWLFISGGLFCMIISFFTVFWQSYEAANKNPVVSIKVE